MLKLIPLNLGKIRASGWFKEQLTRNKNGIGGHLREIEPQMVDTPYTTHEIFSGWGLSTAGWGGEISGNYWRGFIELAFTLDDGELKAIAESWVNQVLAGQHADGYMGTYTENNNMFEDYNAWGTHCGMMAMLSYYSATGREDVLNAVHRCMLWFCENWAGDKKTRYAGNMIVGSMAECNKYVKDSRLVDFIRDYMEFTRRNDLFGKSVDAQLKKEIIYNSDHGAGYPTAIKQSASAYIATNEDIYLKAVKNAMKKAEGKIIQRTGGITCYAEFIVPDGYSVESEYCSFTEFNDALGMMTSITGEALWGDYMERVVFNAAQGARKKDEKAIAYLTSPNQIIATPTSAKTAGDFQAYGPCHGVACCPVNSVRIIPEYIRNMAMRGENGLYFTAYGPAEIEYDGMRIECITDYPFRDELMFRLSLNGKVKSGMNFRIPAWCKKPLISVNGIEADIQPSESWISLEAEWKDGDEITLRLPMELKISRVNDSDGGKYYPLCVEYGAIVFALPIPEKWVPIENCGASPLPEGWSWYSVYGTFEESGSDFYDIMGLRKYRTPWSVAVKENDCPAEVELCENSGYVWENPWIKVKMKGYKAPFSYPPYPNRTPDVYVPTPVTDELTLELVPYGCTNLRITYFPRA